MGADIQYTRTVKICVDEIANHLRRIDVDSREVISTIIEHFETRVGEFPLNCQICPELSFMEL